VVKFRPYQQGDVFELEIREGDDYGTSTIYEYDDDVLSFTLEVDGTPVMCWGIVEADQGVGHLWAYISDAARGHGLTIVKFARRVINNAIRFMFHRIQATVRADDEEYTRFIELFGLNKEGLMRKATVNQMDLWLYARVN
jgi:RimJ/RimL family protein N-acetyltransferase